MAGILLLIVSIGLGFLCLRWFYRDVPWAAVEPRCAGCGYIVLGLPSAVCPECGADLTGPHAVERPGGRVPRGPVARLAAWTGFCALAMFIPLGILWGEFVQPRLPQHVTTTGYNQFGRPQSGAYASVDMNWSVHRYTRQITQVERPDRFTVQLKCNDGRRRSMDVDSASPAYHYHDALGAKDAAGPVTRDALLEWIGQAGIPVDRPDVQSEMEVLATNVQRLATTGQGGTYLAGAFRATTGGGGVSWSQPAWHRWVPAAVAGTVWLTGVAVLFRRARARHTDARALPPGPAA